MAGMADFPTLLTEWLTTQWLPFFGNLQSVIVEDHPK